MNTSHKICLSLISLFVFLPIAASADDGCSKDTPYPPSLVKSFLERCISKPEIRDFCECTINKLQSKMSLYDYVEADNMSALQKDVRFTDSTSACFDKIKTPEE